jgi:hypothetical protein
VLVAAKLGRFQNRQWRVMVRHRGRGRRMAESLRGHTSHRLTSRMRAPIRRHRGAHEDGSNQWLDTVVIDGIAWHNIEKRGKAAWPCQ